MMTIFRTPDARFANLPDWPFTPQYLDISGGLRVHFVDEGQRDAQPVLMLHGEPTWGYLYRHMIGPLAQSGFRALAPDLIGFGRSDKPLERSAYSYAAQVGWMREWSIRKRVAHQDRVLALGAGETSATGVQPISSCDRAGYI
jgi:haloalkane dehalogenase